MLHSSNLFNIFQDNELITYDLLNVPNYFFKYCYEFIDLNMFGFQFIIIIFLAETQIIVRTSSSWFQSLLT